MWLFIGIGLFFGYFLGRMRAEMGRARSDMNKIWDGRSNYRG
jgi:hypothetical protein